MKNNSQITKLANENACFDLQFRKDTRHERTGSPTYYRWKIQFIVTLPAGNKPILEKIKKEIGCGTITLSKNQARLAMQKIDDIIDYVIPYFKKNTLSGNKKKDFELWQKAGEIIYNNKGKNILAWKKSDLNTWAMAFFPIMCGNRRLANAQSLELELDEDVCVNIVIIRALIIWHFLECFHAEHPKA